MKAADIKVGEVYEVERYLGCTHPLRVTRIARDKTRKVGFSRIPVDNGVFRVYGLRLDRETLALSEGGAEEGYVLGKVLGPWDAARHAREAAAERARAQQRREAFDRAKAFAAKLRTIGVAAAITVEGGLSINAASVPALMAALDRIGEGGEP